MRIELERINKSFGEKHVLKDLGFSAQSGKAFGLLGRNGSGKTTTIRIIMGIFPQDSGRVSIDGTDYKDKLSRIGYLPEERGLYPKRVIIDQMVYFGALRGMKKSKAKENAERLLAKLEATEYMNRKLDTLSKGNQQKIQLAISLITDPDILILDEPFSGLDPINASLLKQLVSEMVDAGKLVIFCSHQMASVEELCEDLCIIEQGRIVLSGNLAQIKKGYPRNRVLLSPESGNFEDLRRKLNESPDVMAMAASIGTARLGCAVTLKDEGDKNRLYNAVTGLGISLDVFKVMEPTLEEIFVEKAGGLDAAV